MTTISRSVRDYGTDDELHNALGRGEPEHDKVSIKRDWCLQNYDEHTTRPQTLHEEFERLKVLRSYMILDAEPDEVFQKFTAMACHSFRVPIALVSLVDLGRQWFAGSCGLDAKETPRKDAFCAHAIQRKDNGILHVEDARKDVRFKDNPLVTGPPHIRFYAGAPLISPEGYKLGTFCVIAREARGLSSTEKETLKDLANQTVTRMVARRRKMEQRGLKPRVRRRERVIKK